MVRIDQALIDLKASGTDRAEVTIQVSLDAASIPAELLGTERRAAIQNQLEEIELPGFERRQVSPSAQMLAGELELDKLELLGRDPRVVEVRHLFDRQVI